MQPPKVLRVETDCVTGDPDRCEVRLSYGDTGELGALVLRLQDFAEFVECLRAGFFPIVVAARKKYEAAEEV